MIIHHLDSINSHIHKESDKELKSQMSNLQEQYDILLNSIEFVDPSSYFLVTKTGIIRSNKKIYSLKEMVDLMFSETNDDNHLRIQIGKSLQGEKILYEHKYEFIEDSI